MLFCCVQCMYVLRGKIQGLSLTGSQSSCPMWLDEAFLFSVRLHLSSKLVTQAVISHPFSAVDDYPCKYFEALELVAITLLTLLSVDSSNEVYNVQCTLYTSFDELGYHVHCT